MTSGFTTPRKADRARRTLRGIDEQAAKAVAGLAPDDLRLALDAINHDDQPAH